MSNDIFTKSRKAYRSLPENTDSEVIQLRLKAKHEIPKCHAMQRASNRKRNHRRKGGP